MSRPFRMNPVEIKVQSQRKSARPIDDHFNAPAGEKIFAADTTLFGQVNYGRTEELARSKAGDAEMADGHIVFSQQYLAGVPFAFQKGDLITSIAGRATDYSVIEPRNQAHLEGVSNTIHIFFEKNRETGLRSVI